MPKNVNLKVSILSCFVSPFYYEFKREYRRGGEGQGEGQRGTERDRAQRSSIKTTVLIFLVKKA